MADHVVGVDIGGTKIAAAVVNRAGQMLSCRVSRGHAGRAPEEVIGATDDAVQEALACCELTVADIDGLGVGFAGHVWGERGIVLTSSNLPTWNHYPLRDYLQARIGAPVILENDSNCAAWGEYRFGAGRGSRYMCYVTFSTGFGLGIVLEGRLFSGATGTAGEIGHTVVDPDGPFCTCGKRGCVMSYACGMAISRMAWEYVQSGGPTLLHQFVHVEAPEEMAPSYAISGEAVAQAAAAGDQAALEILGIAGRYFGIGLSTVVQVINPDRIVIGGGLAKIGPPLLDPCMAALNDNIHPVLVGSAEIVPSELRNDAGLLGAADLAWARGSERVRE
ncbi:MAG: ROK family protein [Nitrososphaerales archaeon]